jgi:pyridoxamine 5'-phosphate oxidase
VTDGSDTSLLTPESLGSDPLEAFSRWFAEAEAQSGMRYPNAMTLSTVDPNGDPDGRIVLLKGMDARGFHFYTNYTSSKGRALEANASASLMFYWDLQGRQVRVRGTVSRLPEAESDAYFASRPRESQIGAWASIQSAVIESGRDALDAQYVSAEARFNPEQTVPRPPHWGGFVLSPREIEFWQEVPFRLHDRFRFVRAPDSMAWLPPVRLSP